ncbi:MAG: ABC transporter ATP-binding protein [Bacteroidales bacterium]|nr:ABC transporter ATP-binding protein [Bacteroidales bacterium]
MDSWMKDEENIILEWVDVAVGYAKKANMPTILADHLSMRVRLGEIIGLIGRNGCGKSTLLKTLMKLQLPLNGKILIRGKDVKAISRLDYARLVGYVSTENISLQHVTVSELVALGRFPYTNWIGSFSVHDKSMVNNAIEITGINHLRKKYLHELSDGERQKTMIARVLAQDTQVIVLDEPTAFLDLPNRYELLRLLNELAHSNGKTVIYSTHDLNIAMHESDKIWLMASGKIIEGAPEDLIITKGFHKLFENSDLDFDLKTAEFCLSRKHTGGIRVSGDSTLNFWTSRALDRIGIKSETDSMDEGHIETGYKNGLPVWSLNYRGKTNNFNSIYDLIAFISNVKKII